MSRWRNVEPYLLSILRIVTAFLFMQYGASKLFAFPAPMAPDGKTVEVASLLGVAAMLELFGGGLLLIGLMTRPIAFLVSGEMAVAYFTAHAPNGFWPLVNQGLPAVLFCFLWLYFSAAGAGPLSVDAVIRRFKAGESHGATTLPTHGHQAAY